MASVCPDSRLQLAYTFYPYLTRKAIKLTGHLQDAEDLVQEVYLSLFTQADSLTYNVDEEWGMRAWLFNTLRWRWIDEIRKREKQKTELLEEYEQADPAPTPHERHCHSEDFQDLITTLKRELARLPADQREGLVLALIEEWRYADISEKMGVSKNTVKTWVYRFRQRLEAA